MLCLLVSCSFYFDLLTNRPCEAVTCTSIASSISFYWTDWKAAMVRRDSVHTSRRSSGDKKRCVHFLDAFAKVWKATVSFVMSVCQSERQHGTTRLPLNGFSWNFKVENFPKICRENSNFIKLGQEKQVLCMKTNKHLWSYLAQFFLECEMFQTNVVQKIKTLILQSVTFLRKSCRWWDNMEK